MIARDLKDIRVVALLGNDSQHRNTLATLLSHEINIVGVSIADQKKNGIPINYIFRSFSRYGYLITISRILARIVYLIFNFTKDKKLKSEIFKDSENLKIIKNSNHKISKSHDYSSQIEFISDLKPEILVVHTGAWVGKDIRNISSVKYIIGGHPGITPIYRGAHSPFWAIYNDDIQNIGWTCFLLDSGVDTGPYIKQGFITPKKSDTYMSLSWKGMKEIAISQVVAIKKYAISGSIQAINHSEIPKDSEYFVPTLNQQFKYWLKRRNLFNKEKKLKQE